MRAGNRVLWLYAAWSALMQFEWLRFAPVTEQVARQYAITAGDVGLLSLLFPLMFLPLALPAGAFIDRYSVRLSLRICAVMMLAGAWLRLTAQHHLALFAGQALFALVQPLLLALLPKLLRVWVPESGRLRATGVGTMSLFVGLGLAFVLVPQTGEWIHRSLWIDLAVIAVLTAMTFVLAPQDAADSTPMTATGSWFRGVAALLAQPAFLALLALIFLGNGYFNALFTWLEQILGTRDIDAAAAGVIGLLILLGGLAGIAVAARYPRLTLQVRGFLLISALAGIPLTALFMVLENYAALCLVGVGLGALMLAPLPILIDLTARIAGPALSGTALSTFWLAGNAGSAAAIWALSFPADSGNWLLGGGMLASLLMLEVLVVAGVSLRSRGAPR